MPIKFRCNYCRQFLGISRAQAGGVVDCPTCGRSIRVPLLDGTLQPMNAPELDIEDAHLSRALDELARLVDAPVQAIDSHKSNKTDADDGETENQIPQPLPEPIPIEVPLPPTPVVVQPPVNASLTAASANGIANDRSLLDELASLSAGTSTPESHVQPTDSVRMSVRDPRTDASLMTRAFLLFVMFLAGMVTERFLRLLENLRSKNEPTQVAKEALNPVNQLTGRITFKTKEGESQPERGARVIIFPQQRTSGEKLSVVGFRPADSPQEQLLADEGIKAIGGAAATVDERGAFRIPIEAGTYRLLVLSHFQPRDSSDRDPALDKLLSEYFENPDELLGRVKFQFSPLRIKGTGDTWDHSF